MSTASSSSGSSGAGSGSGGGGGAAAAAVRKPPSRGVAAPFHVQPRHHAASYPTESELEFLAEDTVIDVIPNFQSDAEDGFIATELGPFSPGVSAKVPLWVGVQLKQLKRCAIRAPAWLEKATLLQVLKMEKDGEVFQDLNPHYIEIATILLSVASDDIEDAALIRTIIEDLKNVRQTKIIAGTETTLAKLQNNEEGYIPSLVKFNSASAMEINVTRPHFLMMLDTFNHYFPSEQEAVYGGGGGAKRGSYGAGAGSGGGGGGGAGAGAAGGAGAGPAGAPGARRKIRRFRS